MQAAPRNQLEKYVKLDKLGEGTYGLVYKARNSETGEVSKQLQLISVCLDRCPEENKAGEGRRWSSQYRNQRDLPSERHQASQRCWVSNPFLFNESFRLKEVIYQDDNLYLIFEYCEFDLKKYMRSIGGPLPIETVKKFTYQILQATAYCHAHRVMHRDLKP